MPSIATTAASAPSMPSSMTRVRSMIEEAQPAHRRCAGSAISGSTAPLALRTVPNVPALRRALGREEGHGTTPSSSIRQSRSTIEHVGVVGLRLVAFDDQHARQAAAELLGRVAMRYGRRSVPVSGGTNS